ncbi:MAG: cytochrome d ubiquinol oxidase subunit II [Deltaproteobacteria bacterium RIFOXYA12_FULL_61_11]|nr:MAG: cytochrome d ubiquinol oxidase subunit II [Deltaproteobacteria bacterium RIFOXYA12_FULL_61_11]
MSVDLNLVWYVLVGLLFAGYAVLDGFDLGVGGLHLFSKKDEERRLQLNAIGPVWDGNEVWLVTGGGALFAAFPEVYATAFSGFYLAFMLLLFALITRAVAIEFRSKKAAPAWRTVWDIAFSLASALAALLLGVALGNVLRGLPLDAKHEFIGTFLGLLNPYALLVGCQVLALLALHGGCYLVLKTEGPLQAAIRVRCGRILAGFILVHVLTTVTTFLTLPHLTIELLDDPIFLLLTVSSVLLVASIPRAMGRGEDLRAFLSTSALILCLLGLVGYALFPSMLPSDPSPEFSLTAYNAASSSKTLGIMLLVAAVGMPLVLAYTGCIYRIFRGKVRLDSTSY